MGFMGWSIPCLSLTTRAALLLQLKLVLLWHQNLARSLLTTKSHKSNNFWFQSVVREWWHTLGVNWWFNRLPLFPPNKDPVGGSSVVSSVVDGLHGGWNLCAKTFENRQKSWFETTALYAWCMQAATALDLEPPCNWCCMLGINTIFWPRALLKSVGLWNTSIYRETNIIKISKRSKAPSYNCCPVLETTRD